jgi:hypothetical protein
MIDSVLFLTWVWGYPLQQVNWWWVAIGLNAIVSAAWAMEAEITQIAWLGISMPAMLKLLKNELRASASWGKLGADSLLEQIYQEAATNPTLQRSSSCFCRGFCLHHV